MDCLLKDVVLFRNMIMALFLLIRVSNGWKIFVVSKLQTLLTVLLLASNWDCYILLVGYYKVRTLNEFCEESERKFKRGKYRLTQSFSWLLALMAADWFHRFISLGLL
jgi:hypothetical protein